MKFIKTTIMSILLCVMFSSVNVPTNISLNISADDFRGMERVKPGLNPSDKEEMEKLLDSEFETMNWCISNLLSVPDDGSFRFNTDGAFKLYYDISHYMVETDESFSRLAKEEESFDYAVTDMYTWFVPIVSKEQITVGRGEFILIDGKWSMLGYGDFHIENSLQEKIEKLSSNQKIVKSLRDVGIDERDVLDIKVVRIWSIDASVFYVITGDGEYIVPVSRSPYKDEIPEIAYADEFLEFLAIYEKETKTVDENGEPLFGGNGSIENNVNFEFSTVSLSPINEINRHFILFGIIGGASVLIAGVIIITQACRRKSISIKL
jgi:hypothetical protein